MCGLLFYKSPGKVTPTRSAFDRALEEIRLRGPDHRELLWGDHYVAGHARLAIIDLRPEANQPFWDEQKRSFILFNGEIYNFKELRGELEEIGYRCRTESDTEVLLESILRTGLEPTLQRLRGMFAFVLHDTATAETIVVRDHFGQKPMYYFEEDGNFAAASSIRSLIPLKNRIEPDLDSYATYLCSNGIIDPASTFFAGIASLEAGSILTHHRGRSTIKRYFRPSDLINPNRRGAEPRAEEIDEGTERLEFFLRQSVRRHLVSDVPVGILLSGGIDSTSLYWYAHESGLPLTTLTKVSPGIEEIPLKIVPRILEKKAPARSYFNEEDPGTYLAELVKFTEFSHAPSRWGGGPPMGRLCGTARAEGTFVLLGGDCVDEYFAGYQEYVLLFDSFDGDLDRLSDRVGLKTYLPFFSEKRSGGYLEKQRQIRRRILDRLEPVGDPREKFIQATLLHDTEVFLQACNLPHSDAYSMMKSVELRNPMLDLDLVEFVVNLPARLKFQKNRNGHSSKFLFRELARRRMGDLIDVPKEGTRNYSMKVSDPARWNWEKFSLNHYLPIPANLSKKDAFRVINLEIFHRLYFEADSNPLETIHQK